VSLLLGDTAGQLEVLERTGQIALATLLRSTLTGAGKQTEFTQNSYPPMNADPYPDSSPFFRNLQLSRVKMRVYKYSKLEASYVLAYKFNLQARVGINGYSCYIP
jgi:hypothetical protein